ncbi:MAG: hypothetical protein DRP54_07855 [Spirochaetes bacterium]|nr:MAG: hypothetical protein DRP54_07855 [Spirochaetota bacterium]
MKHEVHSREIIFNEFFKIEKAVVGYEMFDGKMGQPLTRYIIRRGDSVGIVAVIDEDGLEKVVLVNQFRYPAVREGCDGYLWEIPAGMLNKGENPEETAIRELEEETGLKCNDVREIARFFLSPGAMDEMMYVYLAIIKDKKGIKEVGGIKHEDEYTLVKTFTEDEIVKMIGERKIIDAKTIASLMYYFNRK